MKDLTADDRPSSAPQLTADGHHVVIAGRRWRATDPSIPDALLAELRSALMTARRAVGSDRRRGADERASRAAVHDAKIALGERGRPWWEPVDKDFLRVRIAAAIRTLAGARSPGTTCPSDVARVVGGGSWRTLMPVVREVAAELVAQGSLVVTQHNAPSQPPWRGPIRLQAVPHEAQAAASTAAPANRYIDRAGAL